MAGIEKDVYGDFLPSALRYSEIHERYAASRFGIHHATQPARYSVLFGYDREQMIQDLGADVHPVRHMSHTESAIVRPLVYKQNQLADEKLDEMGVASVRLAAILHDVGECEHPEIEQEVGSCVGDQAWGYKTNQHEQDEAAIRRYIYGQIYDDIPGYLLHPAEDIIANAKGTLEREIFQVAERIGYYQTALRAGDIALKASDELKAGDFRATQLSRLAVRVSRVHRNFLQPRSDRFPYVDLVLGDSSLFHRSIQNKLGRITPEVDTPPNMAS